MSQCSPEKAAKISKAMKAQWMNKEYRTRQIDAHRGKFLRPETRTKLSIIRQTPEFRAKQSAISKALWQTAHFQKKYADGICRARLNPKWKEKIISANRKKAQDPAWRAKISATICQKYLSDPTYREKLVKANLGKQHSHTTRMKMSISRRGKTLSPETRTKISIKASTPERRAAVVLQHKGKSNGPETLRKMRIAAERRAQNPEWLKKQRDARLVRPNKMELSVRAVLDQLGILYIAEYRIGPYLADMFVPEKQLVIECDGDYWHKRPGAAEKDAKRDAYMAAKGYTVLRLPEKEIQEGLAEARLKHLVR